MRTRKIYEGGQKKTRKQKKARKLARKQKSPKQKKTRLLRHKPDVF